MIYLSFGRVKSDKGLRPGYPLSVIRYLSRGRRDVLRNPLSVYFDM